jgi:hypothetical protein
MDAGMISLSPDGKLALVHFGGSMTTGGVVREGVGGVLLVDAETLAPLREPIRMTFKPAPVAWAPDSSRFYVACSQPDDVGDAPTDARLQALTESEQDYIAAFSADGVLIGAVSIASWTFTPDSGWSRLVRSIAASNDRVYIGVAPDLGDPQPPRLLALNSDTLAVEDSLPLGAASAAAPTTICVARGGSTVTLAYSDRVAEVAVADGGALSLSFVSQHTDFTTYAPIRADATAVLQLGPESRAGVPADNRRFHYNHDTDIRVVRGYRDVSLDDAGDPQPEYVLDLNEASSGHVFKTDFCLAVVGTRRAQRKA